MAYTKGAKDAMQDRQPLSPSSASFEPDINEVKEWSEEDIRYLKAAWKHGTDLQELCLFLCRADWEAVAAKCAELGFDLKWQAQRRGQKREVLMKRAVCDDCGWVCENHPDRPFQGESACTCGGAGAPCPRCNETTNLIY
jgi:hypothetical protein